jgi:hypothetical protein
MILPITRSLVGAWVERSSARAPETCPFENNQRKSTTMTSPRLIPTGTPCAPLPGCPHCARPSPAAFQLHLRASTTLWNSTSIPSPVFFTIRPRCSLILGSISSRKWALSRSCVPSSSALDLNKCIINQCIRINVSGIPTNMPTKRPRNCEERRGSNCGSSVRVTAPSMTAVLARAIRAFRSTRLPAFFPAEEDNCLRNTCAPAPRDGSRRRFVLGATHPGSPFGARKRRLSLVATRVANVQPHNLKVVGSNPTPATR